METHAALHRHPGTFVRENVIPPGMTIKEAARRLGIGRPALSNFINGKSALSSEMAVRLEKAFGFDRKHLVDLQSAYDLQQRHARGKVVAVRAFVPSFLTIKARQIEDWSDQIDARTHLPVLVRKLVQSTGNGLIRADFPGYDNAQRKGNDGFAEASAATPWVPEGLSFWEFGTNKGSRVKAEKDYSARLKSVARPERDKSTFIFVTPRNWSDKTTWEKLKNEAGDWKEVRAFDASDLEQWLEQSVPAQIWLAEQIGLPVNGYETLEQAWSRWANASEPRLTPEIFAPSITAYQDTFKKWLTNPSNRPFLISADSRDEALAFLACLFDAQEFRQSKDLAAIFTSPATLRTLTASSVPFIPIVVSEDVERELADAHRRLHCIVFRPRNDLNLNADITLDLLGDDAFRTALDAAGVARDQMDRLARESGCSPTILRRRLSKNAAIRTPVWAGDDDTAKGLVPMALIGAWNAEREADREILSYVADRKYEAIQGNVMPLLQLDDSPVWSAGSHQGVVSKIDALFAVARMITPADLDRFFFAAEIVLSETHPALDLPEDHRWAAVLYDKTREHSDALRKGICETLVILSVHGNDLLRDRIGVDVEARVSGLIRKLLTPLALEKLLSNDQDLPYFAEAAPDEFLKIIEGELDQDDPVVFGLLKPVNRGSTLVSPSRTGLLWAMECLAWNPSNLSRVTKILARLSTPKIEDNWMNKPVASLHAIFRHWWPQTAATVEQRVKALKALVKNYPELGWEICIAQITPGSRFGLESYRPRWRSDASGAGQVVAHNERYDFAREALGLIIDWSSYDHTTLGDLVDSLEGIPEDEQTRVWDLIDKWSCNASDSAKAALRERIRRFALTRRASHRKIGKTARKRAREAYEKLQPQDPVSKHGWLFANHWVQESANEFEEEEFDWQRRYERVDRLRRDAMNDIWAVYGFQGVEELLPATRAAHTVGHYAVSCVIGVDERVDFIRRCLSLDHDLRDKAERCLQGALRAIEDASRTEVLQAAAGVILPEDRTRLFVNAPFRESTWRLLEDYGEEIRIGYWKQVYPSCDQHTPTELSELIDSLLEVGRPRAAFQAAELNIEHVDTSRLKRLLHDIATVDADSTDQIEIEGYYISEAFDILDDRIGVTRNEMAELEFLHLDVLYHSTHGVPNLERMIVQSPTSFVQAIALVYERSDGLDDPSDWVVEDPEQRASVARRAYRLLDRLTVTPGEDEYGRVDVVTLSTWLNEARRLCREHGRAGIGDRRLGQLLAQAPKDQDGSWPCKSVCEAMEEAASAEIDRGFLVGVRNSRGVYSHSSGEGGQQERDLAAKYRVCAEQLRFDYPHVGGVLEDIAVSYDRDASWQDFRTVIAKRLLS